MSSSLHLHTQELQTLPYAALCCWQRSQGRKISGHRHCGCPAHPWLLSFPNIPATGQPGAVGLNGALVQVNEGVEARTNKQTAWKGARAELNPS